MTRPSRLSFLPPALFLVLAVASAALADPRGAPEDAVAGEYTGTGTSVTLTPEGGGSYSGEVTYRGSTFPLTATTVADRVEGTFSHEGQAFPFTIAAGADGKPRFTTGSAEVALTFEPARPPTPAGGGNPFDQAGGGEAPGSVNPFDRSGKGGNRPAGQPGVAGGQPAADALPEGFLGAWSDGQYVMEFMPGGRVNVFPEGQADQAMQGTYTVTGNALTVTVNGQTQASTFSRTGDTMAVTDAQGSVDNVTRIPPGDPRIEKRASGLDIPKPGGGPATGGMTGAWTDGQYTVEFNPGGQLKAYPAGQPAQGMTGTYAVQGDRLTVTLNGQTETATFTVDGDQLTTTNAAGEVETVTRLQPDGGGGGFGDDGLIADDGLIPVDEGGGNPFPPGTPTHRYQGDIQGTTVDLTLAVDGNRVTGVVLDPDQYRYDLELAGSLSRAVGTLFDPQTGGQIPIELASSPAGGVTLTLIVEGQRVPYEFQAITDAPAPQR